MYLCLEFVSISMQRLVFPAIQRQNNKNQQYICHKSREIMTDLHNGFEITRMEVIF